MKNVVLTIGLFILLGSYTKTSAQNFIKTVAGNGGFSASGDDSSALTAAIGVVTQVCLDTAGNIYIADQANNCVRKVSKATGIITTVAGVAGTVGYTGDGGPATNAHLHTPDGVAVDAGGNIYISDNENHVIRKVDYATGIISTWAGGGSYVLVNGQPATNANVAPLGLCVDKFNNLYVADAAGVVRKINPNDTTWIVAGVSGSGFSGDGGLATNAALNTPWGVYVDSAENIYIADFGNLRIRKVDAATGNINTVAGNGTGSFINTGDSVLATSSGIGSVSGMCVDDSGNIYFPDEDFNRIYKVQVSTGMRYVIANKSFTAGFSGDNGPALTALLDQPRSICLDHNGNLYIADAANSRIREMYTCEVPVAMFADTGSPAVTFTYTGTTTALDSVHWQFGDGNTGNGLSLSHLYTAAGIYHVCVTAYTNCDTNTYCHDVTVSPTGIRQTSVSMAHIYPNPVNDILNISNVSQQATYTIFDVLGSRIKDGCLKAGDNNISVASFQPGIYIFVLTESNGTSSRVKIVKQ